MFRFVLTTFIFRIKSFVFKEDGSDDAAAPGGMGHSYGAIGNRGSTTYGEWAEKSYRVLETTVNKTGWIFLSL
jgi:hypothetical protein